MSDRYYTAAQHCNVGLPYEGGEGCGGGQLSQFVVSISKLWTIRLYRRIIEQDLRKIVIASFLKKWRFCSLTTYIPEDDHIEGSELSLTPSD